MCIYKKWPITSTDKESIYESLMLLVDTPEDWHFRDYEGHWAPISNSQDLEIALEVMAKEKIFTITRF